MESKLGQFGPVWKLLLASGTQRTVRLSLSLDADLANALKCFYNRNMFDFNREIQELSLCDDQK